jgi:hypothetical protein
MSVSILRSITTPSRGGRTDSGCPPHTRRRKPLRINALGVVAAATFMTRGVLGALIGLELEGLAAPTQERTLPAPSSLTAEHALLHTALTTASRLSGSAGAAAHEVRALVEPHFAKEQRQVFPLLRLLPMLSHGEAESWTAELLPIVDPLDTEIPILLREHLTIRRALERLTTAAWREGHSDTAFLAQRLERHIQMEEEVFYPAALLVGKYLRLRLPSEPTAASP